MFKTNSKFEAILSLWKGLVEGRGRRGESNGLVEEEDLVAVTVSSNDRGLQTDAVS